MAKFVNIPGQGTVSFPDTMTDAEIENAIKQNFEGNVFTGAGKRLGQIGEAATGLGMMAGEKVGVVSPESLKQYQAGIQESRSVFSPEYGQYEPRGVPEISGFVGTDLLLSLAGGAPLKAAQAVPIVGRAAGALGRALLPETVPQAMAGGALYGLSTPSESLSEAAGKAAIGSVVGGTGQFALRQIGLAPKLEANLTEQQKEVARRALQQGFELDPTQITGLGGGLKEGIKSRFPLAREAFTNIEERNQNQVNQIAKQLVKIPAGADLTNEAMQTAYNSALRNYKVLETLPSLQGNAAFVQRVDQQLNKLNKIPNSQRTADDRRAIRVLSEYKSYASNPISGEEAFIRSKAIGDNLFQAQKSGSKTAADAFKELRGAFEQSIDDYLASPANLMRTGGKETLDQFREGRRTLSNWYLVKDAFNEETGNVMASKLSKELSKRPSYGTTKEPVETAAMLSGAFPRAFPSSGTSEREAYSNIINMLTQAPVAIPAYAATAAPVRNILAQRYLGAQPQGLIGGTYGAVSSVGGMVPENIRSTLGRALMAGEQQQIMQGLTPTYGLLGQ